MTKKLTSMEVEIIEEGLELLELGLNNLLEMYPRVDFSSEMFKSLTDTVLKAMQLTVECDIQEVEPYLSLVIQLLIACHTAVHETELQMNEHELVFDEALSDAGLVVAMLGVMLSNDSQAVEEEPIRH